MLTTGSVRCSVNSLHAREQEANSKLSPDDSLQAFHEQEQQPPQEEERQSDDKPQSSEGSRHDVAHCRHPVAKHSAVAREVSGCLCPVSTLSG